MSEHRMAELPFVMLPVLLLGGCFKAKEIALYACLLKHCDKDTYECYPSRKTLAHESGMSIQSVDAAVKSLQSKEMIEVVPRYKEDGRRTSNLYKVIDQLHVLDDIDEGCA